MGQSASRSNLDPYRDPLRSPKVDRFTTEVPRQEGEKIIKIKEMNQQVIFDTYLKTIEVQNMKTQEKYDLNTNKETSVFSHFKKMSQLGNQPYQSQFANGVRDAVQQSQLNTKHNRKT
jgi:hypothetical protein